jgi:hypothetical protein
VVSDEKVLVYAQMLPSNQKKTLKYDYVCSSEDILHQVT